MKYPFTAITFNMVVPVRVPSVSQIELFSHLTVYKQITDIELFALLTILETI